MANDNIEYRGGKDIVIFIDINPYKLSTVETCQKLENLFNEALDELVGQHSIRIVDLHVQPGREDKGDVAGCFELSIEVYDPSVESAIEIADFLASRVCKACRGHNIPISDGFAEVRVLGKYLYSHWEKSEGKGA